jgi:predicted secreted Zn-dependent protease
MTTQQILIRLPEDVAARLKAVVPSRKRNQFVADLVIAAVIRHEENLSNIAAEVTAEEMNNPILRLEMQEWDTATEDGIEDEYGENKKS